MHKRIFYRLRQKKAEGRMATIILKMADMSVIRTSNLFQPEIKTNADYFQCAPCRREIMHTGEIV